MIPWIDLERREDVRTIEINEIIAKEANGRPLYNKSKILKNSL